MGRCCDYKVIHEVLYRWLSDASVLRRVSDYIFHEVHNRMIGWGRLHNQWQSFSRGAATGWCSLWSWSGAWSLAGSYRSFPWCGLGRGNTLWLFWLFWRDCEECLQSPAKSSQTTVRLLFFDLDLCVIWPRTPLCSRHPVKHGMPLFWIKVFTYPFSIMYGVILLSNIQGWAG